MNDIHKEESVDFLRLIEMLSNFFDGTDTKNKESIFLFFKNQLFIVKRIALNNEIEGEVIVYDNDTSIKDLINKVFESDEKIGFVKYEDSHFVIKIINQCL